MAQVTEAIYTHGVLKPVEALALREAQRVRLVIELLDDATDRGERSVALQRLRAGIEAILVSPDISKCCSNLWQKTVASGCLER